MKVGGYLLVSDAHFDARQAFVDPTKQLRLVAAIDNDGTIRDRAQDLEGHFMTTKGAPITLEQVEESKTKTKATATRDTRPPSRILSTTPSTTLPGAVPRARRKWRPGGGSAAPAGPARARTIVKRRVRRMSASVGSRGRAPERDTDRSAAPVFPPAAGRPRGQAGLVVDSVEIER